MRYPNYLESRRLAPCTINVRLAAVRRLAYEPADTGLLSPELAAGIRRVKGLKKLGLRLGNWLSADEDLRLINSPVFFVLYRKTAWIQLLRSGAVIWAAIASIENASETTMTKPTVCSLPQDLVDRLPPG